MKSLVDKPTVDFEKLNKVKCKIDKKERFNYISWANAWKELKTLYPTATFSPSLS